MIEIVLTEEQENDVVTQHLDRMNISQYIAFILAMIEHDVVDLNVLKHLKGYIKDKKKRIKKDLAIENDFTFH
jgi:hypothetical protein